MRQRECRKVVYLRSRESCKIDDSDVITVEQETKHEINNSLKR